MLPVLPALGLEGVYEVLDGVCGSGALYVDQAPGEVRGHIHLQVLQQLYSERVRQRVGQRESER
jgi:hypothetical protein